MAEYTLHCFAQSGNAYKPALALELAGADWAPRFVDYFGGETRTPAYRAINVMGEVPVLEHRGAAAVAVGRDPRLPRRDARSVRRRDAAERREILRWLLWDNHKLTSYTATYRFLRTFTKDPDPAVLAEFRQRAEAAWGVLDAPSRRPPLCRRRPADDRRPLAVRLPVLAGGDRRRLGRVSCDPRLARADPRDEPRWVHPVRADAGASAARSLLMPRP